jgi:acyl-CoA synthetase (AMP-forming)/AMP-acid ligase II
LVIIGSPFVDARLTGGSAARKSASEVDVIVNYGDVRGFTMLLGDIIRRNGTKTPDRVALLDTETHRGTVTFGELLDKMRRVANAMLDVAQPGDRIGILAENLPEYVECYYGVPAAGMALTFLNYRLHPKEWAWILNNAEASVLDRAGQVPRGDRAGACVDPEPPPRDRHRRWRRRRPS